MPRKNPELSRAYYYAHLKERKAYLEANRDRISARGREYSIKNKDALARKNKLWRETNADRIEDKRMLRVFGISLSDYRAILDKQKGMCAVCDLPPKGKRRLDVDHDHDTGKVRGLLCWDCNVGIGKLGDNIAGLERALNYMRRSSELQN